MWSAHRGKAQPEILFQIKSSPAAINHSLLDEAHTERTTRILGSSVCHLQPQQVWFKPQVCHSAPGLSCSEHSPQSRWPRRSQNIIYKGLDFSTTKLNNTHPPLALNTEVQLLLFTIILLATELNYIFLINYCLPPNSFNSLPPHSIFPFTPTKVESPLESLQSSGIILNHVRWHTSICAPPSNFENFSKTELFLLFSARRY